MKSVEGARHASSAQAPGLILRIRDTTSHLTPPVIPQYATDAASSFGRDERNAYSLRVGVVLEAHRA